MKYYVKYRISENISETPEGYLVCIGVPIARTGEMLYGPGETPLSDTDEVKISRDESEVFKPETMASFEGKAITIKHPETFVGPDNWSELAKGVMQNVRRGTGEFKDSLLADLLITDKMAIGLVKNGLREVSCGYEADYEEIEEGLGKQKNIIGNHLALVNQGRAGSSYAINDHKGESKMSFKDKVKAIFAKAQDEAMKMADDEEKKAKDEDKKEDKAKDEDKKDDKKEEKSEDAVSYDELVQCVKDLGEKVSALAPKAKDEDKKEDAKDDEEEMTDEEKKDDKKEEKSEDEPASMEDRMKALETAVEKLLDNKAGDEDMSESEDEDEEESEDDDFDESTMVGDSADVLSRAEILAPGIEKSKDIKVKALKQAYGTKQGKKVIDSLTGGKTPTFDSAEKVETLFIAASELLKQSRTSDLSKTKRTFDTQSFAIDSDIDAQKINDINAKFYKNA